MVAQKTKLELWRDVVGVKPRFLRSVHLEHDAHEQGSLEGYILTPLVRTITGRIIEGLRASAGARAWSITGPYGTGKSAFAVFLTDVLSTPDLDASRSARPLLERIDPSLAAALSGRSGVLGENEGLCPVLATGERRSLDDVLLRGLHKFVEQVWSGRGAKPALLGKVNKLAKAAAKGHSVSTREIVGIFEQTAQKVAEKGRGRGLLVVLDEAGKVLEHAAQRPEHGDMQLLQELAESANRSGGTPIVFVVVLHQAFEQYAGRLSLTERSEWAKVQGRFQDLAFQEASHEFLRLVGEAFDSSGLPPKGRHITDQVARTCAGLVVRGGAEDAKDREALLCRAVPLHPITTLLLGPLFRSRLAQNERSLFAFLASEEPSGFQQFLATRIMQDGRPQLFRPDALYDYIVASLGSGLHGHLGKQWAQIEVALQRLPKGAGTLDAQLIKTIGLLSLFGDAAGVGASDATFAAIYSDGTAASGQVLSDAVKRLQSASLIIFRKFRNAYQLWEGSDLDLDGLVRNARDQLDAGASLVACLVRVAPPRPQIARRHLFTTGTFRYFELRYVGVSAFNQAFPEPEPNADGGLFLVIEPHAATRGKFIQQLEQPMQWMSAGPKPALIAVPHHVDKLLEVGADLAALAWVQGNTSELHDDLVAQRELSTRVTEAEKRLRSEMVRLLDGRVDCTWRSRETVHTVDSARDLARVVSDLCDAAYWKAPTVHNELLNRPQLSSSAAAARRGLMVAMVEHGGEARLGFEGTPPEVSMYRSLLEDHGLHAKRHGKWGFGEPTKTEDSLRPVWKEIQRAVADAREERLAVPALFQQLRKPPFGVNDGLLPVLLLAAVLAWDDDVALYEEDAFVPALNGAIVERLLRAPEDFALQRVAITGPRAVVYERLIFTLAAGTTAPLSGLVPLVRYLLRTVRELPEFARATKTVSAKAQAVREALLRAKEPAPLLFHDLPVACGGSAFAAKGSPSEVEITAFVGALDATLLELNRAYPNLLDTIEHTLRAGMNLPEDFAMLQRELVVRAKRVSAQAVEPVLKAFLLRVSEDDAPRAEWLVSIATLLAGKPPDSWRDQDLDQMRLMLSQVLRRFASLEALVIESLPAEALRNPVVLRLGVARLGESDQERVVPVRADDMDGIDRARARIRALMQDPALIDLPTEAFLAALGLVTRDMIAELNGQGGSLTTR